MPEEAREHLGVILIKLTEQKKSYEDELIKELNSEGIKDIYRVFAVPDYDMAAVVRAGSLQEIQECQLRINEKKEYVAETRVPIVGLCLSNPQE